MMNHNALGNAGHSRKLSVDEINDEDSTRSTFAKFQAREEEIERKKMEVKEKVEMRLGQAEQETRRLAEIWEVSQTQRINPYSIISLNNPLIYLKNILFSAFS